jgi:Zn-dependent protease
MILSFREIIDMLLMCFALAFIFGDLFSKPKKIAHVSEDHDPIEKYRQMYESPKLKLEGMKFAMAVAAPAIIFHELGHKIVAMSFGYQATFHAAYVWLAIGIVMKLMKSPFIFFVPAYVSYTARALPVESAIIAFAGPLVNLLLFVISYILLKTNKINKKYIPFLILTKKINLFLFFFNMIPFGLFDGAKVFGGLLALMGL